MEENTVSSSTAKSPMSNKKFLAIWIPIVAVVAIIAIGANIAIGMFRGAIESYLGTGTYTVNKAEGTADYDTDYYTTEYTSPEEAEAASATLVEEIFDEGMTLLMVTHEMKFAREVATHVIYLCNGQVEEEGPPEQIFGAPRSERLKQFIRNIG